MLNIYKIDYIKNLEIKYNNYFKLARTIKLLPPILKKVGVIYYLAFLVIDYSSNIIKRPIGVILINKVTGQEKVYDANKYDFCPAYIDFDLEYYNINSNNYFYPNLTSQATENFKVSLDILANATRNKFFNIDNTEYQKYLNRIRAMFPQNYFMFFDYLENNEIILIDENMRSKRELTKNKQLNPNYSKQRLIENTINKRLFKKQFRNEIINYIKLEILPILKGNGSYNKLIFYYNFGAYYKEFEKNITSNYICYGYEIRENLKAENTNICIEREKQQIKKMFLYNQNTTYSNDIIIETLSKTLIIILNALLVEEIKNADIDKFEDEIIECIEIFNENKNKITNELPKQFLFNVFDELLENYNNKSNENLCNIYYGYLIIHFPFNI